MTRSNEGRRLLRQPGSIRVEVDDPRAVAPVVRAAGISDDGGRGMRLVAAMADRWGADMRADAGKTVWFELSG
jgi:hypothetical protein